jgi:threonine dehydrogenase-like Zn-dependent dehydrogenase
MSPPMMRAAVIAAPGRLAFEQVPVPEPASGEVRIKVHGTGVCASNLGPWQGLPWLSYPLRPGDAGHEAWGVVDAVGPGVNRFRAGDRVTGLSYRAYAEYDVTRADHLLKLPDSFASLPFPGEAFGCAMNIFARSGISEGDDVAIVGVGFLGAVLVRLASRAGARVIAISRRPSSLELAARMGAAEVVPMDDHHKIIGRVRELTNDRLARVTIECVGLQWPLDLSAEITGERGRLVIAGYHQDGPRQVNLQMWNWRGFDVVNAHERDPLVYLDGIRRAIAEVERGELDPRQLCTHTYPLEQLGEALDATSSKPDGFVKAVVTF